MGDDNSEDDRLEQEEKKADGAGPHHHKVVHKSPFHMMEEAQTATAPAATSRKPAWMQKLAAAKSGGGVVVSGAANTKQPAGYKVKGEQPASENETAPPSGDWGKDPLEGLDNDGAGAPAADSEQPAKEGLSSSALPTTSEHSVKEQAKLFAGGDSSAQTSTSKPAWMQKLASTAKAGGGGGGGGGAAVPPASPANTDDDTPPQTAHSIADALNIVSDHHSAPQSSPSQSSLSAKIRALNLLKLEATKEPAGGGILGPITNGSDDDDDDDGDEIFEDDDVDEEIIEEVIVEEEVASASDEAVGEDEAVQAVTSSSSSAPPVKKTTPAVPSPPPPPPAAAAMRSWVPQKEPPKAPSSENDANVGMVLDTFATPPNEIPDSFAPPRPSGAAPIQQKGPPPPPVLPKQPSMALSTLPKPPSNSAILASEDEDEDEEDEDENEDWMMPLRNEDDSSWVNPSHPVQPERKQHLVEELKKKSVDLFPEDGKTTQRLANLKSIAEESKFNDLEYDAKVGLVVGHHDKGDGQSISETSFSVESKMDRSTRIMESSLPKQEHADVWALPQTYRAPGKLETHKDGKDYRFSYIAQQHTHSTSSYADVVRERYFPKEDNEYWAAPAKESTPELPLHISRSGDIKSGPSDENESWMPPEDDPTNRSPVDKKKYYPPSIADERHTESRSVVTEGSDWMGRDAAGRTARIDFAGNLTEEGSDNSFEWNPPPATPEEESKAKTGLPSPPSVVEGAESFEGSDDDDDEFSTNPGAVTPPRPPSPPAALREKSLESAPAEEGVRNSYDYSPSGRKRKISYSPSGRLKFDDTPKTILYETDEEQGTGKSRGRTGEESHRRVLCCLTFCFFVILVPAAVACIILFAVDPNNKRGDDVPASSPVTTSTPTPAPTVEGATQEPSAALFPPPTPGQSPSTPTPPIDDNLLLQFLTRLSTDGGAALRDPNSPQHTAMEWLKSSANQGIYDDAVFVRRFALATLYYSTGGDEWTSSSGWLTEEPECEWYTSSNLPTICNDEGGLFELNLSSNNLVGSIPPELNLLSNSLLFLQLDGNTLTGEIPSALSDLSNLENLHLAQNELDGSIPSTLGSLSNLKTLYLYSNLLRSSVPTQLGNLGSASLVQLDLGSNQLTGTIPTQLGQLAALESLSFYDNRLTGTIPAELSNLSRLRIMYLDSNSLGPFLPASICDPSLLQLDEFWADCEDIGGCDCCTKCCLDGESCA